MIGGGYEQSIIWEFVYQLDHSIYQAFHFGGILIFLIAQSSDGIKFIQQQNRIFADSLFKNLSNILCSFAQTGGDNISQIKNDDLFVQCLCNGFCGGCFSTTGMSS